MKIAMILPSLAHTGPILVARDIVKFIKDKVDLIDVYYFDAIEQVSFDCNTHRINFDTSIPFEEYDIVHSHMFRPDKYLAKHTSTANIISISTVHCDIRKDLRYNYNFLVSLIFRHVWLSYFKKMDALIMISNSLYSSFYNKKVDNNNVYTILNGRTIRSIEAVPSDHIVLLESLKEKYKIIGSCALLTKRKGLHLIIRALPNLPDYVFVVVGEGKELDNLKSLARKLSVDGRCFFLGFQKGAESYVNYFDVYAMPSLFEGFGLALIEATLFKKSCICSSIPVFKELFNDNEVTFFDVSNTKSLVDAIKQAYDRRDLLGELAYSKSVEKYSLEVMGQKYHNVYKKLINDRIHKRINSSL